MTSVEYLRVFPVVEMVAATAAAIILLWLEKVGDLARSCELTLPRRAVRPTGEPSSLVDATVGVMVTVVGAGVVWRRVVLVRVLVTDAVATVLISSRIVTVFIDPNRVPSSAATVPMRQTSIECTGVALGSSKCICPRIDSPGAITGADSTRLPMVSCRDMRSCGVRYVLYFGGGGWDVLLVR